MIERRLIRFDHDVLAGLELPCFAAVGATEGPHLCLLAGIHGGEYSSIAAIVRFMNALDTHALSGRITAVPIVSLPSFRARTLFVMPQDRKNLNRCFPGSLDGTFSEVLAHFVFEELIAPSDYLLDLHGGDMVEALEPFALYDESSVEEQARDLAIAFGLPYVVRSSRSESPVSGTTASAAAAAGVPAVIAEAGGRGLLEEDAVRTHVEGVGNALRHLGMLPGNVTPPLPHMRSVGRFVWLRSTEEGWWQADVGAGDEVAGGASLGTVRNYFGDVVENIPAPDDGVVLFLTTSPAVSANGLLLGLGVELGSTGRAG
ncbi:MAG TPA: succinylglutamate desuccinylase/aspartoacylase family protein, partial [Gaiellaceae bacterium]|nr:succinylglutamate desuccinylase/aspartoacylase family protein [Gaiellaceae bacterium]